MDVCLNVQITEDHFLRKRLNINTLISFNTSVRFICYFSSVSSMSEDDGHESGCDTVEGSPTSDTSTSPRSNSPYQYLDNSNHNNRPPLAAMVAPLPSPAVQGRSPRGVRTMVVPPMRVQNNNTQGIEERFQRMGQWWCLLFQQDFYQFYHYKLREFGAFMRILFLTHRKVFLL